MSRKIDPYSFEELILDGFELDGYRISRNEQYSGDGGKDGVIHKGKEKYLLQCKRYRNHIRRTDVEDFSRLCTRECSRGFLVHTGKTGAGSKDIAQKFGNVEIVGGDAMLRLAGYKKKDIV